MRACVPSIHGASAVSRRRGGSRDDDTTSKASRGQQAFLFIARPLCLASDSQVLIPTSCFPPASLRVIYPSSGLLRRTGGGLGVHGRRGAMTTTAAMNVAVTQLCGRGRRRRPSALRLDLRWARLLRLAVATRVVRLVWDQLLACSSCGGGGGARYRRLGPPHGADVLSPVAMDDDAGAAADADADADEGDVEDVVGLKVSLLGDCQIGKTSFMVINALLLPCFCRPAASVISIDSLGSITVMCGVRAPFLLLLKPH